MQSRITARLISFFPTTIGIRLCRGVVASSSIASGGPWPGVALSGAVGGRVSLPRMVFVVVKIGVQVNRLVQKRRQVVAVAAL